MHREGAKDAKNKTDVKDLCVLRTCVVRKIAARDESNQ
jgi:hypothetical protein